MQVKHRKGNKRVFSTAVNTLHFIVHVHSDESDVSVPLLLLCKHPLILKGQSTVFFRSCHENYYSILSCYKLLRKGFYNFFFPLNFFFSSNATLCMCNVAGASL